MRGGLTAEEYRWKLSGSESKGARRSERPEFGSPVSGIEDGSES
jgi:hypothetical protein